MRRVLSDLVADAARAHPDRPALAYRDETLTYRDLERKIDRFAASLGAMGVARGDRVATYLEKRPEGVIALFGAAAASAAFVPINPVLKPRQVAFVLADCGARVLVTSADRLASLRELITQLPELTHIILVDGRGSATEAITWDDLPCTPAPAPQTAIDVDLCAILYTSGSTGTPKGVALTHRNMIAGAESVNAYLHNSADDVILAVLPLSFDAGLSQLTTGFAAGAHVILMNYLIPGDVVRMCERHGVTAITCVPPLWIQLADQDWGAAGAVLRYFASTGGRMPRVTLDKLRGRFPNAVPFLMYGLTEAFRSTYLDPDQVDIRPDSIGKAIPNSEVLVLRPDGSRCDPGEPGELVHRGALVALGYWKDADRTRERFRPLADGRATWTSPEIAVWSGDVVRADDEGYLYFVGRADEMIKTSGYRVSPTEIEEAAQATELVRDVVAFGVDNEKLGQRIVLVVSGDGDVDVDALRRALRRDLPTFMVPSRIAVRESIPRGANGKYDRAALRRDLLDVAE